MKTIWKFPLPVEREKVEMPVGAKVLCVQVQQDTPCLWAEVDPEAPKETRLFATYGTGHGVHPGGTYLGSYQLLGGAFVGHVYERP